MTNYDHQRIELKWQKSWQQEKLYEVKENKKKKKFYCLDMFPYPSGAGLHVGHPEGYTASDIYSRYLRMAKDYNVLHPMGWDAFGLPAENYAIKTGRHPVEVTAENIKNFKQQIKSLGFSYDWSREINTTDPKYYKWTQWIFLKLFKRGLAYEAQSPINWCPVCKTGLANEEVVAGKCERCGAETSQKNIRQWLLKITAYADRLLEDLKELDWPEPIKLMQKNWIGKSEGAEVCFRIPTKPDFFVSQFVSWVFKNPANKSIWFLTFSTKNREPIFQTKEWSLVVINSIFNSCLKHNFALHEISVMEDHIHVIIDTDKKISIGKINKYLKGYSSKKFHDHVSWVFKNPANVANIDVGNLYDSKGFHLWTPKGEHSIIKNQKDYQRILNYVQANPEKDKLLKKDRLFSENLDQLYCELKVFTTRPDTLFGATFMVLTPEHELVQKFKPQIKNWPEVKKYLDNTRKKSDLERADLAKEKTGVELKGVKAINPANNQEIPIWIADYILASYGTGAIMAVPAHDERDFEFALKYNIPFIPVVKPKGLSKSVVLGPSVKEGFKQEVKKNGLRFEVGLSSNNREHIRVTLTDEQIEKYIKIIQSYLKQNWWVEIIGSKNIFILKDKVINDFLNQPEETFEICYKLEPLVRKFKNIWEMLRHNVFYKDYICFIGDGVSVNSDSFNDLSTVEFKKKITQWLEKKGLGQRAVHYKLRDWVFSRQRYWGEPIPLIHCKKCGIVPLNEKDLPLELPRVKNYQPTGTSESPLANIKDWVNTKCPKCKGPAQRETNTMPQWAGSCWYYLRYIDPHNDQELASKGKLKYWLPVDLYIGGAEHAVLHLLYARFWHKVLYDEGLVPIKEPFVKLMNQGMILGEDNQKMSKSRGNVINPDDVVKQYGADTLRLYEMFMGPLEDVKPWSTRGVVGVRRFLEKVWEMQGKIQDAIRQLADETNSNIKIQNSKLERLIHQTIKKVSEDIENFRFNTAISALMILTNELQKQKELSIINYQLLIILLSPFAPHITEELWERLGHKESIFNQKWPKYDQSKIQEDEIELVVQVNGKVRDKIKVSANISESGAVKAVKKSEKIKKWLGSKEAKKVIFVKGKLLNIVV